MGCFLMKHPVYTYTRHNPSMTSSIPLARDFRFSKNCSVPRMKPFSFVPERDCVTFGSLLSQIRLSASVVCDVGAPYSQDESFRHFLHRCVLWSSSDLRPKFYGDRPSGTCSSGALNARRVRGSEIERWWTCRRLYLMNGTR